MISRLTLLILLFILVACNALNNTPLKLLSGQGPIYPENLQDSGVQGYVVLSYGVNVNGEVIDIRIVESDPAGVFDSAAVETVSSWRFSAKIVDGVALPSRDVISRISFTLSDEPPAR